MPHLLPIVPPLPQQDPVLRPAHLQRMLCTDQAFRAASARAPPGRRSPRPQRRVRPRRSPRDAHIRARCLPLLPAARIRRHLRSSPVPTRTCTFPLFHQLGRLASHVVPKLPPLSHVDLAEPARAPKGPQPFRNCAQCHHYGPRSPRLGVQAGIRSGSPGSESGSGHGSAYGSLPSWRRGAAFHVAPW